MPKNVIGNSISNDKGKKIDTSVIEQKPYLRTSYIDADIEEDIHFKNQYRNLNLPDPVFAREGASKT